MNGRFLVMYRNGAVDQALEAMLLRVHRNEQET